VFGWIFNGFVVKDATLFRIIIGLKIPIANK
jgi:hypothetical protein